MKSYPGGASAASDGVSPSSSSAYVNGQFCLRACFSTLHARQLIVAGSENGAIVIFDVIGQHVVQRLHAPLPADAAPRASPSGSPSPSPPPSHGKDAATGTGGSGGGGGGGAALSREAVLCVSCHPRVPVLVAASMDAPFGIALWAHAQAPQPHCCAHHTLRTRCAICDESNGGNSK